ncbi:hypothetical protein [Changchengzhania lutea]|uniref:hypothetical protein n=1 Tax=Changchengzhania lutea TaxID=2049305 RepID=UPI00115EE561|nr:hypothetical protein [Changchengzhania lutea]
MHHVKEFIIDNKDKIFDSISAIGLILDMIGVYLLFKLKDKYFDRLKIAFKIERKIPFAGDSKPVNLVNSSIRILKNEFNDMINELTLKNQETSKKANKAMVLIILGFGLQFLVYAIKIFH